MSVPTWVVGSGGLLGGAVLEELRRRGDSPFTSRVSWLDPVAAREVLTADTRRLIDAAAGGPWRIAWCAGAGVNGAGSEVFAAEQRLLRSVLDELAESHVADNGVFFHASSAGGVYAGVPDAPHTELSPVQPLGDYGLAKLASEAFVTDFGRSTGARVVNGRIANLYGPGQNLDKPQGLISHLCRGYLLSAPISIYVPMDTLRDYLFVTDAAEMVSDTLETAGRKSSDPVTKIYASGRSVTIGAILGACRAVFRRRPNVVLASSKLASLQGRDLRLRSIVWPEVDHRTHRTLHSGIAATLEATRAALSQ